MSLSDLPHDIILDIFFSLPVKTLIRLKFVCKTWFYLISNPDFINTHLAKSHLDNTKHKLLLSYMDKDDHSFQKSCSFVLNKDNYAHVTHHPDRKSCYYLSFLGSCNGLVCTRIGAFEIMLWNPVTRKSKKLPVHKTRYNCMPDYGFGYDQTNDDYKVVVMNDYHLVSDRRKRKVDVYSLKTDSWRKIMDLPYRDIVSDWGKYVNGLLHWKVGGRNFRDSSRVIFSFDLANETYGEILQPCYSEDYVVHTRLNVLEGCISVTCHYFHEYSRKTGVDIWVMKVYGVEDTWIKLYNISTKYDSIFSYITWRKYIPLCTCMAGDILLNRVPCVELYNRSTGEFSNLMIDILPRNIEHLDAIMYVESLISPNR